MAAARPLPSDGGRMWASCLAQDPVGLLSDRNALSMVTQTDEALKHVLK